MSVELRPCPECLRHVRIDAGTCPFCNATYAQPGAVVSKPHRFVGSVTRAAVFAGAALLAPACGGDDRGPSDGHVALPDSGPASDGDTDAATPVDTGAPDSIVAMPYGAPPARDRVTV